MKKDGTQKKFSSAFILANPLKCLRCHNCKLACAAAGAKLHLKDAILQGIPLFARNQLVEVYDGTMSVQCEHCQDAPCVKVCLTGAIHQDDDGGVSLNQEKCVGCKACISACHIGAIKLIHLDAGEMRDTRRKPMVANKCDLCFDLVVQGKQPACIKACPTGSLILVLPEKWRQTHLEQSARNTTTSEQFSFA